ncbi:MAG: hypothetical protein ICV60_05790 [Pyrinomonadaceae bacterium]|nr:hypothetical protein [Pyrinomonadaceae bacterium]
MKFQFKPESSSQLVEIRNGERVLRFERAAEPFEISETDARLLKGVDELEPVPDAPPAPPKNEGDGAQGDASEETKNQQAANASSTDKSQKSTRRNRQQQSGE